jgi:hypothetical protein
MGGLEVTEFTSGREKASLPVMTSSIKPRQRQAINISDLKPVILVPLVARRTLYRSVLL